MTEETKRTKLALASSFLGGYWNTSGVNRNPWSEKDFDKLDQYDVKEYRKVLNDCRFFYKHDPLASTITNKLIDIGLTTIRVDQGTLSDNEYKIFSGGVMEQIQTFIEEAALEYLTSGLVIPEIKFTMATKLQLEKLGVKRRGSLQLPDTLYIRNPDQIKIKRGFMQTKPSYFLKIPDTFIFFIMNNGIYPDMTEDKEAYRELQRKYPELVAAVKEGKREFKLENDNIIQTKTLSNSDYPIPFLYPALEPMRHKRNIRRMDYAIASRAIAAILQVKVGNDEFPITEDEPDAFDNIESQMRQRNTGNTDIERIFQLFTNHTVEFEWIFPKLESLLNNDKYEEINEDILYALGFPRILVTGETQRTGTSNPKYAMMSPYKSMEKLQRVMLPLAEYIVDQIIEQNKISGRPSDIRFEAINLHDFAEFIEAVKALYESGNLSRESYAKELGYNITEELSSRKDENEMLEEMGLEEYGPVPFSKSPEKVDENKDKNEENKEEDE